MEHLYCFVFIQFDHLVKSKFTQNGSQGSVVEYILFRININYSIDCHIKRVSKKRNWRDKYNRRHINKLENKIKSSSEFSDHIGYRADPY